MENYNTVSGGLLNTITGGAAGTPTNYGLQGAYQDRINTVTNTLQDKYGLTDKDIADIKAGTFNPEKMNVQTDLVQRLVNLEDAKKEEADMLGLTAAEEKRLKELDFKDYFAGNKDQDSVDRFDTTPSVTGIEGPPSQISGAPVTDVTRPGTGTVLGKEGIERFDDAETSIDMFEDTAPITTGGPPSVLSRPTPDNILADTGDAFSYLDDVDLPSGASKTGTPIDALNPINRQQHFDNAQKLKEAVAEGILTDTEYKQLSALDAVKTMGLDPITGTLSAIGYQGVQAAAGDQTVANAISDIIKNIQGLGNNISPEAQVKYQEIISGEKIYRDPILGMVEEDEKTLADENITNIDDYITNEDLFGGFDEKEEAKKQQQLEEAAKKQRELQQKIRDAENQERERVAAEKAAAEKAKAERIAQEKIRDAENQERERVAAAEKAAAEKAAKEREMQQRIRDAERAAEEKAARDKATRERDLGGGPQFGDRDKATREKDLGSGPPGIGGGGGDGGGGGCFLADTLITMADGSTKEVQKVDLGDNVAEGGKVFATGKFLVENLHDYKGIKVSGSHMVNEDDNWVRVKDSKHGKPLGDDEHTVYVFGSENRRILINGILFTDYFETTEQEKLINDEKNFFNNWKTYENKIDQDNINILNAS
jgi:hypothetical protein